MAGLGFHFERLCDALEVAEAMEDREEAAKYLRETVLTIRRSPQNTELRLWFLKSALELLGVEHELDVALEGLTRSRPYL